MHEDDSLAIVRRPAFNRSCAAEVQELEPEFNILAERALSRRAFLDGSLSLGLAAFLAAPAVFRSHPAAANGGRLSFRPVAANTLDTVTVPDGYSWHIAARWGDPLWSDSPLFDYARHGTGASQERAFGDNVDGMTLFAAGDRNILVVNNEYVTLATFPRSGDGGKSMSADDVRKSKAAHGVSIVEIAQKDRRWSIVKDSPYNRRITADTPMDITGPARGHNLLKTARDPSGSSAQGTWNNCGNGRTPWGTYLACEENFNNYFSSSDENFKPSAQMKRYGIKAKDSGNAWARFDERFDISKHPNEPNRVGYIVEIDPLNPSSVPRKRTALGRFKHENAEVVLAANGQAVVYMGDDERGEFVYRFISSGRYVEGGSNGDLLAEGKLYAAKFADGGRGEWVELTPESTGMKSPAEICVYTRQAASAVKATTMDRPEWIAANPWKPEVYCCLTNNTNRGKKANAGGDATPVGGPNPRAGNKYGQIVRWTPDGGDHLASGFAWDLFVVAGNPAVHTDAKAGSKNVHKDNMFNSPDGLAFSPGGILWIQTDGNYSNAGDFAGQGNNQMLAADPATGEVARFLVGPRECEVTGLTWSTDRKTMFVGIQHPGEKGNSHFPDGGSATPCSAVIAVTRSDGGIIG
ncbi:MAG: PhoX family phosphatase [Alphaproteobacteria bacterium]